MLSSNSLNHESCQPTLLGMSAPEGVDHWWSARAIYHQPTVEEYWTPKGNRRTRMSRPWFELVSDHCGFSPALLKDEKLQKKARRWWASKGGKLLIKWLKDNVILAADNKFCTLEEGGWVVHASPMASYGYLYIVVYQQTPQGV